MSGLSNACFKKHGFSQSNQLCSLIHEDDKEFYEDGIIDEAAMHEFDVDCLVPTEDAKAAGPKKNEQPLQIR
jgi:hypothetical protein